ncbi:MAG TPA: hypothetical protein DCS93_23110 [Microscillaceae bacterium]|nr:hypothetical protein [Microscillaceae bacterium]
MTVYQHSLYNLALEQNQKILSFRWADDQSTLNYEQFQEACTNYAGYAFEYASRYLLIDTHNFTYQLPEEYRTWLEQKHYPRFYKLGVQKIAYLMAEEAMTYVRNEPAENGKFATHYFTNEKEALEWLSAN